MESTAAQSNWGLPLKGGGYDASGNSFAPSVSNACSSVSRVGGFRRSRRFRPSSCGSREADPLSIESPSNSRNSRYFRYRFSGRPPALTGRRAQKIGRDKHRCQQCRQPLQPNSHDHCDELLAACTASNLPLPRDRTPTLHTSGKRGTSARQPRWAGPLATATGICVGPSRVRRAQSARALWRDAPTATDRASRCPAGFG
jgi:hypothetical protein